MIARTTGLGAEHTTPNTPPAMVLHRFVGIPAAAHVGPVSPTTPPAQPTAPATPAHPTMTASQPTVMMARTPQVAGVMAAHVDREQTVQMLNPALVRALDQFQAQPAGQLLNAIHLPTLVSADRAPTDTSVFTDPDHPDSHCGLGGGFQLAFTTGGTMPQKWVELRPGDAGHAYTLEVHLDPRPLASGTTASPPIPASVPVTTRFLLHATVSGMPREWDFEEFSVTGTTLTLRHHVDGSNAEAAAVRDLLLMAMTKSPDAKLIVRRSLSLAFLLPPIVQRVPPPEASSEELQHPVGFPIRGFPPHPVFPHPIVVTPEAPRYNVTTTAIDSTVDFTFDREIDENVFAKLTGADVGTTPSGWKRSAVLWRAAPDATPVTHSYYQDMADPDGVYFLPDAYELSRVPTTPHRLSLTARVLGDGSQMTLGYAATPTWAEARITDAWTQLKAKLGRPDLRRPAPFATQNAVLKLEVPKGDPSGSGGPGSAAQPGATIHTELAIYGDLTTSADDFTAVFDAVVHDSSRLLLGTLTPTVEGNPEEAGIPVNLRANQFIGPVVDVQTSTGADGVSLQATVRNGIESPVVVNTLPVIVTRGGQPLPVKVLSATPALGVTLAPAAGAQVADAMVLTLGSSDGSALADVTVLGDPSAMTVQTSGDGLLDAILDPAITGHASRTISVSLSSALFVPGPTAGGAPPTGTTTSPTSAPATDPASSGTSPAGTTGTSGTGASSTTTGSGGQAASTTTPAGAAPPLAVQVEFVPDGPTVTFVAPPAPIDPALVVTHTATLQKPLRDFILGKYRGTGNQYQYRVRVIYVTNQKQGDVQTDEVDLLYPQLPALDGG